MANGIEVAKAYVTIVPTMEGSQATITKELTGVTNEASEKAGSEGGAKFGDKFAGAIKGAGVAIGAALTAATGAAVATGKAFLDAANDVSAMGDAIGDNAAKMMLDTQSYQEWDFVLQRAGSSIDAMKASMKTLANAAAGGSEAFDKLGISQEQVAKMNQAELFEATVKALQNVTDEQERTAIASSLLGKGALELGGIFNMTNEELDASKQKMYELGAYMDEDAIAASDNYQDTLLDMQDSLKGLKISMMTDFLPGVTSVMDGLAKVFSGDSSGIGQIQKGLEEVITNITQLAPQFFSLAQTIITSLLSGFAPMLPQIVSTVFGVLIQAVTIITGMLPQMMPMIISGIEGILSALFDALPVIVEGLGQFITSIVTWLSEGDNVTRFVNGLIELATQIVSQIAVLLPVLLPAIVRIISEIAQALTDANNIKLIIDSVLVIVGAVVVALIEAFPEFIELIGGLLENASDLLLGFTNWIQPFVNKALDFLINLVKTWGNNIKSFITNLINNIKTGFSNWLNSLKTGFTNAFNTIRDKVQNITNKVKELVSNVIEKIKELPDKVVSIGRNLVEGLWNGINDKIAWVKNKIYEMGDAILNAIKGIFGIASPSKEFAKIGGFLAEGLGEGFEDEMQDVRSDMVGSMDNLTGNMTATVSAYGVGASEMGNNTTYNGGAVTINVYGAQGQSTNDIANQVALKLEEMTRRKGAIYA